METIQKGVLEKSEMFFYSNNQGNKNIFYYPLSAGHFFCNKNYSVRRKSFNSILVTYIVRGSFSFILDEKEVTAKSGDIAIIDCYNPHKYYTNDSFEAYWIHIDGCNTKEIFCDLKSRKSSIIHTNESAKEKIINLFSKAKNSSNITATEMAKDIYSFLMSLYDENGSASYNDKSTIEKAVEYISNNLSKKITVEEIANFIHLSPSQFSHKFKNQLGTSPYNYILNLRITKAKELLKNTNLSISEIAYKTGFNSDANFIYSFKKEVSTTPLKFRNIKY